MKVLISHYERRLSRATVTDVAGALGAIRSAGAQLTTSFTAVGKAMTTPVTSFSSAISATASSMTAFGSLNNSLSEFSSSWSTPPASADANYTDASSAAKP